MRALIQRVSRASVTVSGERLAEIGQGLVVLLGVAAGDTAEDAHRLARKTAEMRIFSDAEGRFNLSLLDMQGEALVVSQFTLLADTRRGRRPSFSGAAPPEEAEPLVEAFAAALRETGVAVRMGRFGAHMLVEIHNEGPVTIFLDSEELERPRRG
ncbi:MAG: D-aminoacyl-tRNA deacylase [Dehalococcoidia bacterium]|nr:D-aminoacyl-tRNA deacylase [Dehalococcoidia bacterium]